jgi:hypothetical protein
MAYLCTQRTRKVQIKYFMFEWSIYRLFVTYRSWKTCLPPNNDIRICLFDMRHIWTKNAFWDLNNKKWRKWCNFILSFLFNDSYGLPVLTMGTNCPNQVIYVCLVDLHYICINRGWKFDSLQMMIFVNICSTWRIVELKTCFETWMTRIDVNVSYLITLISLLFMFVWSIYRRFVLSRSWRPDPLQMMVFLNACSTWSMV